MNTTFINAITSLQSMYSTDTTRTKIVILGLLIYTLQYRSFPNHDLAARPGSRYTKGVS